MPRLEKSVAFPARAEWDFTDCPKDEEKACRDYEFAREALGLRDIFIRQKAAGTTLADTLLSATVQGPPYPPYLSSEDGLRERYGLAHGLDKHGYWHVCEYDRDRSTWGTDLVLAPGWPELPYLKTDRSRPPIEIKDVIADYMDRLAKELERDIGNDDIRNDETTIPELELMGRVQGLPETETTNWEIPKEMTPFLVDFRMTDRALIIEFEKWLKASRTLPGSPKGRGHSAAKECLADLNALGAFRLLRVLAAPEALAHTKAKKGRPLYRELSDWYKGKKRATDVINRQFQWPDRYKKRPAQQNLWVAGGSGNLPRP